MRNTITRGLCLALGFLVLLVVSINLENFAAEHGWDKLYKAAPMSGLSGLTEYFWFYPLLWFTSGAALTAMLFSWLPATSPHHKEQTGNRWIDWRPTTEFIDTLRSLSTDDANVHVVLYDRSLTPFGDRILESFKRAGWRADKRLAHVGETSPYYQGGIEISGRMRTHIEEVARALEEAGIGSIRTDNPYSKAEDMLEIKIGYEQS